MAILASARKRLYISAAMLALSGAAGATTFQPVLDEFWVLKNGTEIFRDSFEDGVLPPSGPDGPITYSNVPGAGLAGMTSESGGKLTMTPALGAPTLISGAFADTFTGGLRRASTAPANPAFLGQSDSFEIHGLFDLFALPAITGQAFGIRTTDRAGPGTGNDVAQLFVGVSAMTGEIGVALNELDFIADTRQPVDFVSIQAVLASAAQVELIISKAVDASTIGASYSVLDGSMGVLQSGNLDTINNVTGFPISIYNGEQFTRPQFFSADTGVQIPEPATLTILAFGLASFGFARRAERRRRDAC